MQPQPPIQKKGSTVNRQSRYAPASRLTSQPQQRSQELPSSSASYQPQQLNMGISPTVFGNRIIHQTLPRSQPRSQRQPEPEFEEPMNGGNLPAVVEQGMQELSPEQIEHMLAEQDRIEMMEHPEDEREFVGGKKLYDRQLMQQPMYDEPTMQILNDIAADESFPILVQYITQLSHLGRQAQARLIARAAAFQSKNQVFSNINNQNDYMMAQDDFAYAQILSKCDYSTYDTNADYFTAEAIMEAQFNIRLRRSRNALNLLQINTQRQESIMGGQPQAEEERKLSRKIPFLGQYMG